MSTIEKGYFITTQQPLNLEMKEKYGVVLVSLRKAVMNQICNDFKTKVVLCIQEVQLTITTEDGKNNVLVGLILGKR